MFSLKTKNNYYYVRGEKDIFDFGPFEAIRVKGNFYNKKFDIENFKKKFVLKTWDSWVGLWENQKFVYKKNTLLFLNNLKFNCSTFVLIPQIPNSFLYYNIEEFLGEVIYESIELSSKISLLKIYITKDGLITNLPVFNGLFNKYCFHKFGIINFSNLTNIFDLDLDDYEKKIDNIFLGFKKYIKGKILLTKSKSLQIKKEIDMVLFELIELVIIIYWLLEEIVNNKSDLEKIIKTSLPEFKGNALLLDSIAYDKINVLKVRLDGLLVMIDYFVDFLKDLSNNFFTKSN